MRIYNEMITTANFPTEASKAIERSFSEVPFCTIKLLKRLEKPLLGQIDRIGKVQIGNKEITLLIKMNKSGQPRYAREAINVLARFLPQFPNSYGLFVASFVSEEASILLERENIGHIDLAGNCRICVNKIYICKEGNENRFTKKRDLRSVYSPKGERILRALMLEPKRIWKVEALAEKAEVSLGQVSNVKQLLQAREWLSLEENGFKLTKPKKLLEEWAQTYSFQRNRVSEYYALSSLTEIENQIAQLNSGERFGALTGFSGAARLAPAVRYNRVSAYVSMRSENVAKRLGWKLVTSGGNVNLIEPYDAGVFLGSTEVQGLQLVSPVQIYLDLYANVGRGEEGAEALLREVIQPTW
jgi:hypothetical protein